MSNTIRPITALLDDLESEQPLVISTLYRLSDLGQVELDQVAARWPRLSDERRYAVVQHLADITEGNFQVDFTPVFALCLRDAAANVRRAALEGLWDSENLALVPTLLDMLKNDPDMEVRAAAAGTLGHYVLLTEWEQLPRTATAGVVDALMAQLENDRIPDVLRRAALEAVSSIGDERLYPFIEAAYRDDDEEMQAAALFAMGNNADKRWVKYVRQEIKNESPVLREEAVRAAGNIGTSDLVEDVIEALREDDDLSVQMAAVTALGQMGSEQAREALAELLEDEDAEELHELAEEALEEIDMFAGMELFDFDLDEDDEDWDDEE